MIKIPKQKSYYILGMLQQVIGGAISWMTMAIFVFTGVTFWNTPTMESVREHLPWLTWWIFALIILAGIFLAMWLQHKFVQPSIMAYWNKMFYEQSNPMTTHLKRIEEKIDKLSKSNKKKS